MRMLRLVAAVAVLVAIVGVATAGDYHSGTTLFCTQCHIMHYSQTHDYNPDGSGFYLSPGAGGPFTFLLRDHINNLCLACHDNNGIAPDVMGNNNGNSPSDVRMAGYLNRIGGSGLAGKVETGHTLDSLDVAPGSDPSWKAENENGAGVGLECTNCHHQHGRTYPEVSGGARVPTYRNLKGDVGNWDGSTTFGTVTYNSGSWGTNDLTKGVFERSAASYDESQVDFNEPNNTQSQMARFCEGCHTKFHDLVGSADIGGIGTPPVDFVRHPNAGVNIGAAGGGHSNRTQYNNHGNKVKVMSEVGVWNPAGADVTPSCFSCHKAHGNGNAFGLIYRSGAGTLTEDGDTVGDQIEHLCGQCHGQASAYVNANP